MFNEWLVIPLFNLLALIYAKLPLHDFGLAIIILTILVRILLWPLVSKQLHSQRAMQRLQPEIAKIRARTKGDRQKEGQLMMELYKEKGINPAAAFLPLLVQLPVFFALYFVLRELVKPGEIAHLAYPAIQHLQPVVDVIQSGGSFHPTLLGLVALADPNWLFALAAAVAQWVQTKMLTPKPTDGDAQAKMMASMANFFPIITFVVGLNLPSALALYWGVSSLFAIGQQFLLFKRDVKEMEGDA